MQLSSCLDDMRPTIGMINQLKRLCRATGHTLCLSNSTGKDNRRHVMVAPLKVHPRQVPVVGEAVEVGGNGAGMYGAVRQEAARQLERPQGLAGSSTETVQVRGKCCAMLRLWCLISAMR